MPDATISNDPAGRLEQAVLLTKHGRLVIRSTAADDSTVGSLQLVLEHDKGERVLLVARDSAVPAVQLLQLGLAALS